MVIFRNYEDQAIGVRHGLGKSRVLNRLTSIIGGETKIANVEPFRLDAFALLNLAEHKLRNVLASAPFTSCAENNGNEEWAMCAHPRELYSPEVTLQLTA